MSSLLETLRTKGRCTNEHRVWVLDMLYRDVDEPMRCKACDVVMTEQEVIWDPDKGVHEDLCKRCRAAAEDEELSLSYLEDEDIGYFDESQLLK